MKRKFVKVMFFGALALSTVTYVGCKDYDDDIDNLQTQIDANKADIAKLQSFVKEGKWVTNVEDITGGFKITFNDNKSYSITSGKDATPTTIKIDPVTKNWIVNGNDLGICAEGKKGDAGVGTPVKAGYAPEISEDGYWIVWDAEDGKPKKTNVKAATDIYVSADASNPLVWVLNILNKETGEWEKVSMPKSARITGMSVLGVKEDGTVDLGSTQAEATLYYHKATTDIKFNGNDKFKKAGDLLIARGGSKIHALINPVNLKAADIQAYEIGLTDSKGNTSFVVANIADNFSVDALTRVADPEKEPTANKGVYDLTLRFANGVTDTELKALEENTAYALTTKDAWGNEIISGYDVKVAAKAATEQDQPEVEFTAPDEALTYQKSYNLDELFNSELDKVVAYYYEVTKDEAAKVDATFDKDKNTIIAKKEGKMKIKIHYLPVSGTVASTDVELTFAYVAKQAEIKDMTWVVDGKKLTATSEIVGPSVDEIKKSINGIDSEIEYTDVTVTINKVPNLTYENQTSKSITLVLQGLDAKGKETNAEANITKYVIKATFDPEYIAAVPHTATVKFKNKKYDQNNSELGNEYLYETTFKITVDQPKNLYTFKHATAYFEDKENAVAYGKVYEGNSPKLISFNLYTLYQANSILEGDETTNSFVKFTEVIPEKSGNKVAKAWLTEQGTDNGAISVEPSPLHGGVNTSRSITVTYAPFGNTRLNAIVDKFNLKVLSEIYQGSFDFVKKFKIDGKDVQKGEKEDNPIEIEGTGTVEILESDFIRKDARANDYGFDDNRIVSVKVELADDDAKTYLTIDNTEFKMGTEAAAQSGTEQKMNTVTIGKNQTAGAIINAPTCKVNINILDKWGMTKTASIYVKVNK